MSRRRRVRRPSSALLSFQSSSSVVAVGQGSSRCRGRALTPPFPFTGFNSTPDETSASLTLLRRRAWLALRAKLEEHTAEAALLVKLKVVFEDRFRYDESGVPRVWNPEDDIDGIFRKARESVRCDSLPFSPPSASLDTREETDVGTRFGSHRFSPSSPSTPQSPLPTPPTPSPSPTLPTPPPPLQSTQPPSPKTATFPSSIPSRSSLPLPSRPSRLGSGRRATRTTSRRNGAWLLPVRRSRCGFMECWFFWGGTSLSRSLGARFTLRCCCSLERELMSCGASTWCACSSLSLLFFSLGLRSRTD